MGLEELNWAYRLAQAGAEEVGPRLIAITYAQTVLEQALARAGFPKERFRDRRGSEVVAAARAACGHHGIRCPKKDLVSLVDVRNQIGHDRDLHDAEWLGDPSQIPSTRKAQFLVSVARDLVAAFGRKQSLSPEGSPLEQDSVSRRGYVDPVERESASHELDSASARELAGMAPGGDRLGDSLPGFVARMRENVADAFQRGDTEGVVLNLDSASMFLSRESDGAVARAWAGWMRLVLRIVLSQRFQHPIDLARAHGVLCMCEVVVEERSDALIHALAALREYERTTLRSVNDFRHIERCLHVLTSSAAPASVSPTREDLVRWGSMLQGKLEAEEMARLLAAAYKTAYFDPNAPEDVRNRLRQILERINRGDR